jgi:ABC-type xylose transport system permease subunit
MAAALMQLSRLQLLGLGAAAQNLWTAAVLLAAVTVDTVARRNRPNA